MYSNERIKIISANSPLALIRCYDNFKHSRPVFVAHDASRVDVIYSCNDKIMNHQIDVPNGFICDLGSTPRFSGLQAIRFINQALVHDLLYRNDYYGPKDIKDKRLFADKLLEYMIRTQAKSMTFIASKLIYLGVRAFGDKAYCNLDTIDFYKDHTKEIGLESNGLVAYRSDTLSKILS